MYEVDRPKSEKYNRYKKFQANRRNHRPEEISGPDEISWSEDVCCRIFPVTLDTYTLVKKKPKKVIYPSEYNRLCVS